MDIIYSATKPTGRLTLGNYLGAIKNWKDMQKDNDCIFAVADLHSLTIDMDRKELNNNIYAQFATFLAVGLDPEKSIIYCQSHVKEHSELAWIMNCNTYFGEASRMTQFKDHKAKDKVVTVDCLLIQCLWRGIFCFTTQQLFLWGLTKCNTLKFAVILQQDSIQNMEKHLLFQKVLCQRLEQKLWD